MKKAKNSTRNYEKKRVGKLLMILGLIGITYAVLEPIFIIRGCFGYGIIDALIYIVPIGLLLIGYNVYSKYE